MKVSDLNFAVCDLDGASVGGECRPLHFDDTKYCSFQYFIAHLDELPMRKKKVKKSTLSVNGRVVGDKMENYLSASYESSSALKQALITPRHYVIYKDPRIKRDAKHFTLGTFCHSAFLEPKLFDKVKTEPKENATSKDGICNLIRWYWEQLNLSDECVLSDKKQDELRDILADLRQRFNNEGFQCVKDDDRITIDIIRKTFKTYGGGILPRLLKLADSEMSFYTQDPSTGLDVKVRPDAVLLEENIGINAVVSLKTTSATTIEQFARDAARYKYELSEGMYLDVASHATGRTFSATLMIVLQTTSPWQVFALWWDAEDLEVGKYKYHQALEIIADCKEKKFFPGFDARAEEGSFGIIQFKLPEYARLALPEQYIDDTAIDDDSEEAADND